MVYVGGKKNIAKFICPIIQNELNNGNYKAYIEPFVGGGNIIENINYHTKIAYDLNSNLIELYNGIIQGRELPFINKEFYDILKKDDKNKEHEYDAFTRGYAEFICSYKGKSWGSFAKDGNGRFYQNEHRRNLLNQIPKIKDVIFKCESYKNLDFENCLIYCDPPYKDSKQDYYKLEIFNYENFYNWCREISKKNKIFISETNMPDDFEIIWQKDYKRNLSHGEIRTATIEKLFTLN